MKFYSEQLDKVFDTQEACEKAEAAFQEKMEAEKKARAEKKAERAERAKEVNEAFKEYVDAEKRYTELRNAFIKDYGYWHTTYSDTFDTSNLNLSKLVDEIFQLKKLF